MRCFGSLTAFTGFGKLMTASRRIAELISSQKLQVSSSYVGQEQKWLLLFLNRLSLRSFFNSYFSNSLSRQGPVNREVVRSEFKLRIAKRLLLVFVLLQMASACSTSVSRNSKSWPMVDSVAVESLGTSPELRARFGINFEDSHMNMGIGAGLGTGGAIAAGTALTCGPLFFVCALAVIPVGAAVGALAGVVTASAVVESKTPPTDQLLVLNRLFAGIAAKRTIHLEIRDTLIDKIGPERLAEKSVADATLKLVLADVRFSRTSSDNYALTLKSVIVGSWRKNDRVYFQGNRTYQSTSPSLPLEDWVTDEGVLLNQAFNTCVEGLSLQMFGDIQFVGP